MTQTPAIEGWFTTGAEPALIGSRCTTCGACSSRARRGFCRNPVCDGEAFDDVELSRAAGCGPTPTRSTSRRRRTSRRPTRSSRSRWPRSSCPRGWSCSARWPPATASTTCTVGARGRAGGRDALHRRRPGSAPSGAGSPWSSWARRRTSERATSPSSASACTPGASGAAFVDVRRARGSRRARRRRRRVARRRLRRRRRDRAQRLRRLRRRRDVRPGARLERRPGRHVVRRVRDRRPGPRHRAARGSSPGCARSRWSSAPTPRRRASSRRTRGSGGTTRTGCGSGCSGMTNPAYFALYARRRMDLYGATSEDFAR